MQRAAVLVCLIAAAAVTGAASYAHAHGLIGKRFLPATLTIDDPFVADELSLPTVQYFKNRATSERPATRETDIKGEFSKRLSPNLGLSLGGSLKILDPEDHAKPTNGFDNLEVAFKYVFFKSPEHEALVAAGVGWDAGGTGNRRRVDAESFDAITPSLFFGKGFGDLPDSLDFAQPLALTGVFGVAMPTTGSSKRVKIEDDGSVTIDRELHPDVAKWGFSLQYNLQYLQSFVRDVGLPAPLNRMIPLVELSLQTPLDKVKEGHTTGTVNPGVIWFGRYVQIGVEALVPINGPSGKNLGLIGQLHFYLDDLWPQVFTWTPFHGILGPTQPR